MLRNLIFFFCVCAQMLFADQMHVGEYLLQKANFQGSVLIAKKGRVLFKKSYGMANHEHQIPNTPQTVFRIGSLTKQFTAVAILQLQEQGVLKVSDPIGKFLTDYPNGQQITLHHLLSHSSGIPSLTDLPNIATIQRFSSSPKKTIGYFAHLPLNFTPGSDAEYSDSNYILLGVIIEIASGQTYESYIEQKILIPLGMQSTFFESAALVIPLRASGYRLSKGNIQKAEFIDMALPYAAGGLSTTVEDLFKWDQALKKGAVLKNQQALFTLQAGSAKHKLFYGYGFMVGSKNKNFEGCEPQVIGHYGSINGFEAAFIHHPSADLTIIILSNREKTDLPKIHKQIEQLW